MLRRLSIFTVLLVATGTSAVVTSSPASATGIATSHITSPTSGTHYMITDASPPTTVTVTGTTTGGTAGDLIDLRCYEARGQWENYGSTSSVPIDGNGNFSVQMPTDMPYGTCVLRAVPHDYPGSGDLGSFTGPVVTTEYNISTKVLSGPNTGIVVDYYVDISSKRALNGFESAASAGFEAARLQYSDGSSSSYLWDLNSSLGNNLSGTRALLRIDGRDAYGPYTASRAFTDAQNTPGLPALTYSSTRNATTGVLTIHETDPFVVCPAGAPYPSTTASCPQFSGAGIRLERTIVVDDDGFQVHISDLWRSTDHKAHTLSIHDSERIDGADYGSGSFNPTSVGLKLPWLSSSYQTFSGAEVLDGPSRVPATVFVRDEMTAAGGDVNHPLGALVTDVAPSAVDRADYRTFNFRNEGLSVPAGGTRLVRRAYVMGTSQSTVNTKAAALAARINPYRPDGQVKVAGAATYAGNNVYSSYGTHETTTASRRRGTKATFVVRVQNDGTTADSFKLKAAGGTSSFSVHYYAGLTGSKDITTAVTHGTYRTSTLAPGATTTIRLVVTVRSAASTGALRSWLVTALSAHDVTRKDAVKASVRVSG
ncbi:hypothetical protein [Nocardioides marmorisolisilvae]|uniref:hypothetical protein n=1 Tax=Nocardioides marmorisolisilvae TaxID=1542737 RepID=UPI0016177D77|nr:hypothetical protein [Nocardioides marmorisolisilvae]